MTLSITQKLTVAVAVLSLVALVPAGTALYLLVQRGVESDSIERAKTSAADVADIVLGQLDEDILVELNGRRVEFDKLRVPLAHWLIMRENGRVEEARGIFTEGPPLTLRGVTEPMRRSGGALFTVACVPLAPQEPLGWDDIPAPAQEVVTANSTEGVFLSARRVALRDRTLFDVKVLCHDHVQTVEVSGSGRLVDTERRDLPDRFPADMMITVSSGQPLEAPRIVGWQAHEGELIALVQGRAANGQTVQTAVNRFGEQYILKPDGEIVQMLDASRLWVAVAYDMTGDLAGLRLFGTATVMGGALIWLLTVALAWQVTKRALRPVDEMVRRTARIDTPHLGERLPVGAADDELSRVARTVNKMLDRIQEGYQREQQFTGDASHEMRNPLAKMLGEIDWALSRARGPKEYKATLGRLRRYAEGMQQLAESLLILARLDGRLQRLETEPFDAAELAVEIVNTLTRDATQRIRLELGESSDPMQAAGHRHLIGVLLRNLIDNALRYSPPQSPVRLRISRNERAIHMEVEDEGPGIPQELVALAFNRFHRLEKSRSRQTGGVGLGLSIVQAIAEVHRTKVTLSRGARGGTLATFTLPSANDPEKPPTHSA